MENTLLNNYIKFLKSNGNKSDNTIEQYKNDLNIWFNYMTTNYFTISKDTIEKVELSHIHNFLFYLTEKKNASTTRRRKISTLKSFFNYLQSLGLIKINVMINVESPKIEKNIPKHFDIEECKKLATITHGRNIIRDETIIKLFLSTGMRLSELVSLNVENITKNTVIIKGKGNKERTIYLSKPMLEQLDKYIQVRKQSKDNALFLNEKGTRLQKSGVQRVIRDVIKAAGLDDDHVLVHVLRHSFATLNYQNNVDIRALQKMLGHENISTTQIYTHVSDKKLSEVAENSIINSII